MAAGLGWIGLALAAIVLSRGKAQVLITFEIGGVIVLLIITGLYTPKLFALVIFTTVITGVLINYRRVLYLVFDYWPRLYSNWERNTKP